MDVYVEESCCAWRRVYILHMLRYALWSAVLYRVAASTLRGLSGSGASSSAVMAVQAELNVHAGVHWFWRTSRQISPLFHEMLG